MGRGDDSSSCLAAVFSRPIPADRRPVSTTPSQIWHHGHGIENATHFGRTPNCTDREHELNDTKQSAEDLAILAQLNIDYAHSDQFNDVQRFSEFLAEDFIVQTPGVTRNREEFLEYIAKPRPFKDLAVHDVNIRILSDVALIHARATYTMLDDGVHQEALYTDTYQKREGTWVCVAACAIAPGA
jgi:hypothetical protein